MRRIGVRRLGTGLSLASGLLAGCSGLSGVNPERADSPAGPRTFAPVPGIGKRDTERPPAVGASPDATGVRQTSYQDPPAADGKQPAGSPLPPPKPVSPAAPPGSGGQAQPGTTASPFAGATELSVEALAEQVVARNPSLPQMVAAWQAAAARYPQVTSLDDPLLGTTLAPGALGSQPNGYRFEVFQRFPFPGKLPLKGEVARAEASAAGRDVENVRQQLVEAARDAFYEYYLIDRSTEVNEELLRLLRSSRQTAAGLYKAGRVKEPDVLLLDVEIGRQENRSVLLERQRRVVVARINTLLHLPPDAELPPPPKEVKAEGELPDPAALRAQALAQRLDLLALTDRLQGAKASVQLALREYYPDFDVMGAYDAFWDRDSGQRLQAAVRINLPVRLARREAAVAEAQARLAELQAQLARQQDVAGFEVQQGYEQWRESLRTVRLFEKQVLPPARLGVKSAQAEYATGGVSLVVLLEALRNLANLQDQYYQATTEFFRRRTVLQRALTGTPATSPLPTPAERPQPGQPGSPVGMSRQ